MWSTIVVSVLLVVIGVGFVCRHLRTWRAARAGESTAAELDFRRRQFRRRMQCSVSIALLGVAMFGGMWITLPLAAVLYWFGVLLLVCWIVLLALADVIGTRVYFNRVRNQQAAEHAALKSELRRLERPDGNS